MKFILSRTEDYRIHSKKWIIGYGMLFWLITRIMVVAVMYGCIAICKKFGIDAEQMTQFAGDPTSIKAMYSPLFCILLLGVFAPILEEGIFRLGLSFKRWQIALGAACIPAYILVQGLGKVSPTNAICLGIAIGLIFCLIYFLTTDKYWVKEKKRYYHCAIWFSSISFGLLHLMAFTTWSIEMVPYMLCIIAVPFFGGCAITYYRINLGFWWGVGLHIFNNLPAIAMLVLN